MYSDKFEARLRLIGVLSASRGSGCKFFFFNFGGEFRVGLAQFINRAWQFQP